LIIAKKLTRQQQGSADHSNASLSLKAHSPELNAKNTKAEAPALAAKVPEVLNLDAKQFRLGLQEPESRKGKIDEKITF